MSILTVSRVTTYIKDSLETDELLGDLWVAGEVSNFTRAQSGHLYFSVKDAGASLKCVMWRSAAAKRPYLPRDGDAVVLHGRITVYEPRGEYQLQVDLIQPEGVGLLYQAFLELKERLEAEGLFDAARKRPLPRFPRRIGVVTSPTAAVLRDIVNVLSRRYPLAQVVLAPAAVQGVEAPPQIVGGAGGAQCTGQRRRDHRGPRRRQPGRPVGLQRRAGGARHRRLRGAGDQRRWPRDRLHHRRLRGRPARPHPLRRRRAGRARRA